MSEPNMNAYAVWVAAAVAIGLTAFWMDAKRRGIPKAGWVILPAVVLGLIGARLLYVGVRIRWFTEIGFENLIWPVNEYHNYWGDAQGFGLWGAVGGVILAVWLVCRWQKVSAAAMLDTMAPWAALTIALCRFGEFWIGEGMGPFVEDEALCFFPLAIADEWGGGRYAVFLLEGVLGLILFAVLMTRGQKYDGGNRARLFLILYSAMQIVPESLRQDNCLMWQFMKVSQLIGVLVMAGLMIAALIRWKRSGREPERKTEMILCCVIFLLCVGGCVALEFAMDKSPTIPLWACYVMEAVCSVIMGITAVRVVLPRAAGGAKNA